MPSTYVEQSFLTAASLVFDIASGRYAEKVFSYLKMQWYLISIIVTVTSISLTGASLMPSFKRMSTNLRNLLPEGDSQANRIVDLVVNRINNESFEAKPSDVQFYLWTRANVVHPVELYTNKRDILFSSPFNSSKPVKVLIHGFAQNGLNEEFVVTLRSAYLTAQDVNVITVDWSTVAAFPKYARAANSVETVGAHVAEFLDFLIDEGVPIAAFHLIGFSLGAHVAGSAGNSMDRGTLPRITGLDPASAGFQWPDGLRSLNASDAKLVDVIHTNGKLLIGFGVAAPIGHADFYPNGGRWQHGCATESLIDSIFCSHSRAYQYFAESILSKPDAFTSTRCTSFLSFNTGLCGFCRSFNLNNTEKCSVMGEHASPRARGKFYLYTNALPPFAIEAQRN